jgi:hypothetical protein
MEKKGAESTYEMAEATSSGYPAVYPPQEQQYGYNPHDYAHQQQAPPSYAPPAYEPYAVHHTQTLTHIGTQPGV